MEILLKVEENCNTHKREIEPNSSYLLLLPLAVNSPHLKCRVSCPDFYLSYLFKLSYPLHGAFKHVARCVRLIRDWLGALLAPSAPDKRIRILF